ncbi:MAG: alpha/beta fold hydrolase [Actinomycetota bacterium]|nr:alpha/beta fold hydrolase [Actinomycetota bacterium]
MELESMKMPKDLEVMEEGKPFFLEGDGKIGCLLIHGFTGTTSSMKPLGDCLNSSGVTVLCPRLPGHGTNVKDMAHYSYTDWIRAVELGLSELRSVCDVTFVSGLSMGGTLTLYLAETHTREVAGVIPISAPAFRLASGIKRLALPLAPFLKLFVKSMPGPGGDIKDPNITETAYEKLSTKALCELKKLVKIVERDLPQITVPIRIYASKDDHVVPPENGIFIHEHVSSAHKELRWLENSYHVATLDFEKQTICEESLEFFHLFSRSS